MRRPITLACLLAVAAAAGCGRDDEREADRTNPPIRSAPATAAPTVADPGSTSLPPLADDERARPPRDAAKRRRAKRDREAAADERASDRREAGARKREKARDRDTADAARLVRALAALGYADADVELEDGGRTVEVAVRRADACDEEAATPARVIDRVRDRAPRARTVRVTVAGTRDSLSAYRRARCEDDEPEEGDLVYAKRGSGPFTTPAFAVAARRWTVAYTNRSDFFQASVLRGGRAEPSVLSSLRPGSGSGSFRGPGRFQLKIRAAGAWTVTVRDGV